MSSDALIRSLSADLQPVRRRRVGREAGLLALLAATEIGLLAVFGLIRPNLAHAIVHPFMFWKLGGVTILAGAGSALAIRSFRPTVRPRSGLVVVTLLTALVITVGAFVGGGRGDRLLERLAPVHGMLCATSIVILSLPIMATFAMLMRNGAPTHPEQSATASGFAASACGAFVFAFVCPMNDPFYIVVWYSAACAAVITTSRWLLPRNLQL